MAAVVAALGFYVWTLFWQTWWHKDQVVIRHLLLSKMLASCSWTL